MKQIIVILFCMITVVLSAATLRIDLETTGGAAFSAISEGLLGEQGGWLKEKKDHYFTIRGVASREWEEKSVTVIPKKDGFLTIKLLSTDAKSHKREIAYADVRVDGAEIRNGDFKQRTNGKPDHWQAIREPGPAEEESGIVFIRCDGFNRYQQRINVRKGIPLTIKLKVKEIESK